MSKKSNAETKQQQQETSKEFMPLWSLEESYYNDVFVTVLSENNKKTLQPYPRVMPMEKIAYQTWKETVTDDKGKYYIQRDQHGVPVNSKGARYEIRVITRIKATDKQEYLYSKGTLIGYSAAGEETRRAIYGPEIYRKTYFSYKRVVNEKTMTFDSQVEGIRSIEVLFDMPFNKQNLQKLYEQRESDFIQFVVKDQVTDNAYQVLDVTGNPQRTYELFRDQKWE